VADEDHEVGLYRNVDGSLDKFAKYVISGGSSHYRDADAADFDGDGKVDVLVASSTGIEVSWFDVSSPTQGSLTSSILDAQGWPEWESIEWTSVEPEGTDITFQIRGSGDPDEMGAWSDTLYEPGSLEGHLDSTYRFIQYRVNLEMEEGARTPYLEEVIVHFENMGVEEGGELEPLALSVTPNPFSESVDVVVTGMPEAGSVLVFDLSGRMVRELLPDENGCCRWDGRDSEGGVLPAGCYMLRAEWSEGTEELRLVKL
jgi:hypothetical protein